MWKWFKNLFRTSNNASSPDGVRAPGADNDLQSLRLELAGQTKTVARLTAELNRQRDSQTDRIDEGIDAKIEGLITNAAAPVSQLATQAHLLSSEGKPVRAEDVLAVAGQLIRLLEDAGLTLEGAIGGSVPYDTARHSLLGSGQAPVSGVEVVVRFPAVLYRGKVIHKAGVEKV